KIAIVGGGFVGLTIAAGLIEKDVNAEITIFEERDTLLPLQQATRGGYIRTFTIGRATQYDDDGIGLSSGRSFANSLPGGDGRLASSISTHQIRRDARAALVQVLQKASDSRIELCRLFPMNKPARPWDLRSFLETLHSAQHLRLVGIGILVAADAEHGYI